MKRSPTYRMKPTYLRAQDLEVGKSYMIAPNAQAYFTVVEKDNSSVVINYPKRKDEYATQTKVFATDVCAFDKSVCLYKEKKTA